MEESTNIAWKDGVIRISTIVSAFFLSVKNTFKKGGLL